MDESLEAILGSIRVSTELRSGSELLQLFFTPHRLIFAHIGKRGLGELPGMSLLGRWGAALERLSKGPGEARKQRQVKRGISEMSPDEILKADKDNFDVVYSDVVRVELEDDPNLVGLMILTKDDKFQFFTGRKFSDVFKLLHDSLGEKVEVR